MKAIAVHAIFVVSIILIFLFFVTAIFFRYMDFKEGPSEFSCKVKQFSYCSDWKRTDYSDYPDWSWEEKEPENCDLVGIAKPTYEQCENILL